MTSYVCAQLLCLVTRERPWPPGDPTSRRSHDRRDHVEDSKGRRRGDYLYGGFQPQEGKVGSFSYQHSL